MFVGHAVSVVDSSALDDDRRGRRHAVFYWPSPTPGANHWGPHGSPVRTSTKPPLSGFSPGGARAALRSAMRWDRTRSSSLTRTSTAGRVIAVDAATQHTPARALASLLDHGRAAAHAADALMPNRQKHKRSTGREGDQEFLDLRP